MLKVQDVFCGYYKDINILQGISINAELDRITIIIGANGVGKSTLLKTIYGFLSPNQGRIYYKEEDVTGAKPFLMTAKRIAYIPQEHSVFPNMTVEENLEMGAWTFRDNKELLQRRMSENYERFQVLREKRKANAGSLSGGQQRVVEIARGLMTDPELVLFDEPSAGLEPRRTKEIYEIMERLKHEERRGILLVDQNVRQAMDVADYVYVVEMGKNKVEGTRKDFDADLKEMIRNWF